jgi:hypothetical protein
MSPTLTEPAGIGISPPPRPGFLLVAWSTFLGYVITVLVSLPLLLLLGYAGLELFGAESAGGRGVFYRYDVWSWLAEACIGLLATFITALMVGRQLRQQTAWEVPFGFTFATLLVTGYAPALALTPFYAVTAPVSLVVAALILRWRCEPSGAEPRTALGGVPRRFRRAVAIGVAVVGPLMFAYVLAYAALHPVHATAGISSGAAAEAPGGGPLWSHKPGKLRRYELQLENSGRVAVTDLEIVRVEGSPALQLERVGVEATHWTVPEGRSFSPPPLRPLGRLKLGPDGWGQGITLELRQGRLCSGPIDYLEAVWIRYTVLGTRQEQRLPLAEPPGVQCPPRASL